MNYGSILRTASRILGKKPDLKKSGECVKAAREELHAMIDMRFSDKSVQFTEVPGVWRALCPGVKQVECQLPTHDCTLLNVVMAPGSTIPKHHHANQRETIFVVEGDIIDQVNHVRTGQHGVYTILPGIEHEIHSPHGALLNVAFVPKFLPL
jgi:quercetin dioxygenase-like cupin family protein